MHVVENILYSGSADTVVQSHNINTGELVRSYTGHTMSVSGLQALGGVLITSSLDRIIRCFDIKVRVLLVKPRVDERWQARVCMTVDLILLVKQ